MRRTQRTAAVLATLASVSTSRVQAQSGATPDVRSLKPAVVLLVDTSGSMERMPTTSKVNPGSTLPACGTSSSDERNRWAITLESLTGTFSTYSCAQQDRSKSPYTQTDYDYGYPIPHIAMPLTTGNQVNDGALDAFSDRIMFGLMTFDGQGTTTNDTPLVALSRWMSDTQFYDDNNAEPGMYSYGPVGRLSFPNCPSDYGVNFGARSSSSAVGGMVYVGNEANVTTTNQTIQNNLLSVRPYGGTPISAMLDDLLYYLGGKPYAYQPYPGNQTYYNTNDVNADQSDPKSDLKKGVDPYYACRDRYALMITDGEPDTLFREARFDCASTTNASSCAPDSSDPNQSQTAKCSCPYDTAQGAATTLYTGGYLKGLYVVGFSVDDTAAMSVLNDVAAAGGTKQAYVASTPDALRSVLSTVLTNAARNTTSRSTPVMVDTGVPVFLDGKQYEITAGFTQGVDGSEPWQGLLYRQRFGCDNASPVALPLDQSQGDMFHVTLNDESVQASNQRTLVTVGLTTTATVATASGTLVTDVYSALNDPAYNQPVTNDVAPTDPAFGSSPTYDGGTVTTGVNNGYPTGVAFDSSLQPPLFGLSTTDTITRNRVLSYVDGSGRPGEKLSDIYHSNPVVLPPLMLGSRLLNTADSSLSAFLRDLVTPTSGTDSHKYGDAGRPGVVFVGTNDGVLHAFNLDNWTDKDKNKFPGGWEFWGFVPPALYSKLPSASTPTHQIMFDGTPQVRDMLLGRDSTGAATYATVLVSALRGTAAYVALDVTQPEKPPKFLWQFTHPNLGLTVANPALAQTVIKWNNGTLQERAIAILPGGTGNLTGGVETSCSVAAGRTQASQPSDARPAVRCWDAPGRSLYIVDVATGTVLQWFDSRHFPSPLTGSVVVDGTSMDVSKAAYFTDEDGVLWRLSMLDVDPTKWKVEPIWDLFHADSATSSPFYKVSFKSGRAASQPPLLSRDQQGNVIILVGTGDVDELIDPVLDSSKNPIADVAHRVVSLTESRTLDVHGEFSGDVTPNWDMTLRTGESVTGPLSLFDSVLYFGTFLNPQTTTDACQLGQSRIWGVHYLQVADDSHDSDRSTGPRPMLLTDPSITAPTTTDYERYDAKNLDNSLLLGVSVGMQPLCMVGLRSTDPYAPSRFTPTGAAGGGNYQIRALVGGDGGSKQTNSAVSSFNRALPTTKEAKLVGWGGTIE